MLHEMLQDSRSSAASLRQSQIEAQRAVNALHGVQAEEDEMDDIWSEVDPEESCRPDVKSFRPIDSDARATKASWETTDTPRKGQQ